MDSAELEAAIAGRHWFHSIEVAPGVWTQGYYKPDPPWLFSIVKLPERMDGMRALDMGCADGAYAFEMVRRGAVVTAVDVFSHDFRNVEFLARIWNLPITYRQSTVYNLKDGPFDLVLAMGVLYHLQYPLLGLHCLNALCAPGATLLLESESRKSWGRLSMRFLPKSELNHDTSNWWVPTRKCLLAMLETAGFEIERHFSHAKGRYLIRARKAREQPPAFDPVAVFMANFGTPPP